MVEKFVSPSPFGAVVGFGIRDPRSGIDRSQDPGFGINIPDPQHWLCRRKSRDLDDGELG